MEFHKQRNFMYPENIENIGQVPSCISRNEPTNSPQILK